MNTFNNLKIGARLGLAFAALIALALLVGTIGVTRLSRANESLALIGSDRVPKVQQAAAITDDVNLVARELRIVNAAHVTHLFEIVQSESAHTRAHLSLIIRRASFSLSYEYRVRPKQP